MTKGFPNIVFVLVAVFAMLTSTMKHAQGRTIRMKRDYPTEFCRRYNHGLRRELRNDGGIDKHLVQMARCMASFGKPRFGKRFTLPTAKSNAFKDRSSQNEGEPT